MLKQNVTSVHSWWTPQSYRNAQYCSIVVEVSFRWKEIDVINVSENQNKSVEISASSEDHIFKYRTKR